VLGARETALVDGTVCPVWDWNAIPDLYSGKAKYTGMNVQIACNLKGGVAAIGPVPVHGARHDATRSRPPASRKYWRNPWPQEILALTSAYMESDGIGIVPFKAPQRELRLLDWQREFNAIFSKIRAAVEHAVAKVKTWRMLSREGAATAARSTSSRACSQRYRLFFFAEYSND